MSLLTSLNNLPLGNIFQGIQSYYEMSNGFELQAKAAEMSALGYRQQGAQSKQIAEYNIELDRQDLSNQLDVLSRQLSSTLGVQKGQMAASGIDVSSQSFLSITNQTLDAAIRQVNDMKASQKLLAQNRLFQAEVERVNAENLARAAEYQGELAKYRQSQARGSLFQSFGSLASSLFGGIF